MLNLLTLRSSHNRLQSEEMEADQNSVPKIERPLRLVVMTQELMGQNSGPGARNSEDRMKARPV